MENSGERKMSHRAVSPHLVMAVLYGLNNSYGKIITMGFQLSTISGILSPVIKVINNNFSGLTLSADDWNVFKSDYAWISSYFGARGAEAEEMSGSRVEHSSHDTLLTTCYQHRAVTFTEKNNNENDGNEEPSAKRGRRYTPNIVLQRTTFENLVAISRCIDIHLEQLQRDAAAMNHAMELIVSYAERELEKGRKMIPCTAHAWLSSQQNMDKLQEYATSELAKSYPDFKNNLKTIIYELSVMFREYIAGRIA